VESLPKKIEDPGQTIKQIIPFVLDIMATKPADNTANDCKQRHLHYLKSSQKERLDKMFVAPGLTYFEDEALDDLLQELANRLLSETIKYKFLNL